MIRETSVPIAVICDDDDDDDNDDADDDNDLAGNQRSQKYF